MVRRGCGGGLSLFLSYSMENSLTFIKKKKLYCFDLHVFLSFLY